MEYKKLLLNPKWQKKRLEILQRDNFSCVVCGNGIDTDTQVHVHHLSYRKGCMPWEYDNSNFVTLCEHCHSGVHNGDLVLPFPKIVQRKNIKKTRCVFYRGVLQEDPFKKLSCVQQLVYSFLLSQSLMQYKDLFGVEGYCINQEDINDYIQECHVDFPEIKVRKFSKDLGISTNTFYKSLNAMEDIGIIHRDKLRVTSEIIRNGYFDVFDIEGLSTCNAIFFLWLRSMSQKYNYTINTNSKKLAEKFNTTKNNIRVMLHELSKKGLVERIKNSDGSYGELKINQIHTI